MRNSNISGIEMTVTYPNTDTIINKNEMMSLLTKKYGNLSQKIRKDIDTKTIKEDLEDNDFVEKAKVGITLTGKLKIEVIQREPIVRVYTNTGRQYYIDKDMNIISTAQEKSANVIIASGSIKDVPITKIDTIKNKEAYQIWTLATMIEQDSLLTYQIDEIYKNQNNYILIPKVGDYEIELGEIKDWGKELNKLHYLYRSAFVKYGWDNYIKINLKYNNQVVCTRKENNN
jgi:cell division protein FtsQ